VLGTQEKRVRETRVSGWLETKDREKVLSAVADIRGRTPVTSAEGKGSAD
jgi:hypothetical protein